MNRCMGRVGSILILIFVLLAAGCVGQHRDQAGKLVTVEEFREQGLLHSDKPTALELEARLMSYADRYLSKVAEATDLYQRQVKTKAAREFGLSTFIFPGLAVIGIAAGEDPASNLLDMVVFASLQRQVIEDGWVHEVLGEHAQGIIDVQRSLERQAHLRLDELVGSVDYRDVERRAPQICEGPIDRSLQLRSAGGGMMTVRISAPSRGAFCSITKLLMMPQHILEDLTLGLDVEYGRCLIKTVHNDRIMVEDVPILQDDRSDDHFRFRPGTKTQALHWIIAARSRQSERGVVFLRTVTLLEALKPCLAPLGFPLFDVNAGVKRYRRGGEKVYRWE